MQKSLRTRKSTKNAPKWSIHLFILIIIVSVFWVIPTCISSIKADFILMGPKDTIDRWTLDKTGIDSSEWDQVRGQLEGAYNISPTQPNVLAYLGNQYALRGYATTDDVYLAHDYLLQAIDYYALALEIKPVDPVLWVNYANALHAVLPKSTDFKIAFATAKLLAKNEHYLMVSLNAIEPSQN